MKKYICVIALIAVFLFTLVSCGSSVKNAAYDNTGDYGFYKEESAYDGGAPEATDEGGAKSDYLAIEDASSRKLVRDAELNVETQNFDDFTGKLAGAVTEAGGYIESSSESGSSYSYSRSRSLRVKIRIPAGKLDDFLGRISEAATVTSRSVSVKDITGTYIDTQSRIKALETEYDALLKILAKADTVSDLITVQNRLTEVNAELESCKAKLKTYDEMVAYSTVDMYVSEVERVTSGESETFSQRVAQRFGDSLYEVGTGIVGFAVWFLGSLPYFVIIAVIILAIVLIIRHLIKKRKAKKAGLAPEKKKRGRKAKKAAPEAPANAEPESKTNGAEADENSQNE